MRLILLTSLLTIPACMGGERADTGQCPAGETCSPATPNGLEFVGTELADSSNLVGPAATAIGGTQEVDLEYNPGTGIFEQLDLPYQVDDDGGIGVRFDHQNGSIVTVRGVGSRTNYLRITDTNGELYDRKELAGAKLDTIALVPADGETVPDGASLVFAAGHVDVGVGLWGAVQESGGPVEERIVDTSLIASLASATQPSWDQLELANANAGTYSLAVTAGDVATTNLDVTVVDAPDAMISDDPPATILPSGNQLVCFDATNAGRYVVGLSWSYTVDGQAEPGAENCIEVTTAKTSGSVTVVASAGGQTASAVLTVSNQGDDDARARKPQPALRPTAGERAAM
jgi:hypothetical protein